MVAFAGHTCKRGLLFVFWAGEGGLGDITGLCGEQVLRKWLKC